MGETPGHDIAEASFFLFPKGEDTVGYFDVAHDAKHHYVVVVAAIAAPVVVGPPAAARAIRS